MTADPVALEPRARPARVPGRPGAPTCRLAALLLALLALAAAGVAGAAGVAADSLATPAAAAPDSVPGTLDAARADSTGAEATLDGPRHGTSAPATPPEPVVDLWETGVDPTRAVLVTPLFPGWGQLYADGGWRAALAFGAEMYFWSNLLARDRQARRDLDYAGPRPAGDVRGDFARQLASEHHEQVKDFAWWSGGALLIIALDAYVGAHLFDFGHDPVPVPDRWQDAFGPVGSLSGGGGGGPEVTVFQWRTGF
jgi:hypothetical protein